MTPHDDQIDEKVRSTTSADISSTEMGTSPVNPTRIPGACGRTGGARPVAAYPRSSAARSWCRRIAAHLDHKGQPELAAEKRSPLSPPARRAATGIFFQVGHVDEGLAHSVEELSCSFIQLGSGAGLRCAGVGFEVRQSMSKGLCCS